MIRAEDLGHTEYLPVSGLLVDTSYQRNDEINHALVREIATNPDVTLLQTLTIARRVNGDDYIVDGQHRWLGISEHDPDAVLPCRVLISQGVEWEADKYVQLNYKRLQPTAHGRYKAGVRAGAKHGYDTEVWVHDMLERLGITYSGMNRWGTSLRAGGGRGVELRAIGLVIRYARYAPELIERTLTVLRDAWQETGIHNTFDTHLISAVLTFLAAHESEVQLDRLTATLAATSPNELLESALLLRGTRRISHTLCITRVIAEDYNRDARGLNRVREIAPNQYGSAVATYRFRHLPDEAKQARDAKSQATQQRLGVGIHDPESRAKGLESVKRSRSESARIAARKRIANTTPEQMRAQVERMQAGRRAKRLAS